MSTLKDVLDVAIQGEKDSQALYQRGVDIADDKKVKEFFQRLVKEENLHETILFSIKDTGLYDLTVPVKNPEVMNAVRDAHGVGTVVYEEGWDVEQILSVALKREFTALNRYETAANASTNEELASLLKNLSDEEAMHPRVIEKQYNVLKGLSEKEI